MPMIDMTIPLTDPYLTDSFAVLRRQQTIDDTGQAKIIVNRIDDVDGIVFPEGDNDLERRDDMQFNSRTIGVITRFAVRGESRWSQDGKDYQPDWIVWNGNNYLVVSVESWDRYGRGFVKIVAESVDAVDQPTQPVPLDDIPDVVSVAPSSIIVADATGRNWLITTDDEGILNYDQTAQTPATAPILNDQVGQQSWLLGIDPVTLALVAINPVAYLPTYPTTIEISSEDETVIDIFVVNGIVDTQEHE